jgi:large subunit ribosomal protein L3
MTRTATFKGLLGAKLGMTQIFDENARVVPVTVIQAGPNTVTQVKSPERDGYSAVQLAFGEIKAKRVNKPRAGHFSKAGVEARRHLVELRTADAGEYSLGQELKADVFAPGDRVDVVGVSKGKGFAGVMKRHGFKGLSASHGTERKHRSAGHMGNQRVTVLNLEVVKADPDRNQLLVRGAVPGPKRGLVMVRSSVKAVTG